MRIVVAEVYGGPEVLRLVEAPVPVPRPGEILIRVEAAGTNPSDAECRAGKAAAWFDDGPYVWGWDVSGVVADTGPGVSRWSEGDEVFGMPLFPRQARSYADYLVCPESEVAVRPASLEHMQAASLPLSGLTALQIIDLCDVRPGHRVLVNGAAGGVGQLATQLAVERGAVVTGVARAADRDFVLGRGAREVLDYTAVDIAATVRGMDVIVDCVGDDALLACARPGGVIAPVPGGAKGLGRLEQLTKGSVRVVRHVVRPDGPGLGRLASLVDTCRLRTDVAAVRPLDEARAVHTELDAGRGRGKVVFEVGAR